MVLPRKINFRQMGRHSDSCGQRFRRLYERDFDRMELNTQLMWRRLATVGEKQLQQMQAISRKRGRGLPISAGSGRAAPER